MSCEAFSMATSMMLFSLSLLFFISYYNICSMSFEFSSKIQNLTTKLQGMQQNSRKSIELDDVKDQLRKLSESIQKQLVQSQKRIFRIENRLDKCQDNSKRSSRAIDNVWNDREQKVSEIIGGWVDQYQEKAEQTRNLLVREEMTYKIKLQEEQDVITKEMRMQENRIKDLCHTLEKEMNKLATINTQNCTALTKEMAAAKQALAESMKNTDQLREDRIYQIQSRLGKMRQGIQSRCRLIKQDITGKSSKLKQVLRLLLEII